MVAGLGRHEPDKQLFAVSSSSRVRMEHLKRSCSIKVILHCALVMVRHTVCVYACVRTGTCSAANFFLAKY